MVGFIFAFNGEVKTLKLKNKLLDCRQMEKADLTWCLATSGHIERFVSGRASLPIPLTK